MDVNDIKESEYVDLFNLTPTATKNTAHFSRQEQESDILSSVIETTTAAVSSTGETTTIAASTGETTTLAPGSTEESDILGEVKKAGRKPKYDFSDMKGYYEDRIKNGKFVKIDEEVEDGTKRLFLPSTPEEFDEVFDLQLEHQLKQKEKEAEKNWYQSKTPAWQTVAKYAEYVDSPADLIPFLQGVQTIASVKDLNDADPKQAETIIRTRMRMKGEPEEIIDSQIDLLKSADKLLPTAKQYKPLIIQEEQLRLAQDLNTRKQEEQDYMNAVTQVKNNTVKALETPFVGTQKLKREEKAVIYDLIGEPSTQSGWYPIYHEIENLYEKGDFATLTQLALLLANKDAFFNYYNVNQANIVGGGLQRKLRVSTEKATAGSGADNDEEPEEPIITRNQIKSTGKFGRGR